MSRALLPLVSRLKTDQEPQKNPLNSAETIDFSAAPDYWKMSKQAHDALSAQVTTGLASVHAKLDKLIALHDQKENVAKMQAGLKELDRLNKKPK